MKSMLNSQNKLKGLTYYQLNAMDNKFKNVDQLLTYDVDRFCSTLVDVYSNIAKVGFISKSHKIAMNFLFVPTACS